MKKLSPNRLFFRKSLQRRALIPWRRFQQKGESDVAYVSGFSKDNYQAQGGRNAAQLFVEQLRHPKPRVREEAARQIAGVNWNGSQPPLKELILLLKDPVAQVRASAADALGAIGHTDAAPHLIQAVDDESRLARFRAAFALENLNPPVESGERVRAWRSVVKRDPQNVYALCNLSMAFRDRGDNDAAIETAYHAIELHPDHFYPYLLTGRLFAEASDQDAAVRYYECAVYCDPEQPMPHYELGETRRLGGDYEQAALCYERANELTGGRPECYFGLGFCFNRMGEYGAAIDAYERCLEMHPDHYIALNNLGLAYRSVGELEQAARRFKQALELNPDYAAAQLNLGDTFVLSESNQDEQST